MLLRNQLPELLPGLLQEVLADPSASPKLTRALRAALLGPVLPMGAAACTTVGPGTATTAGKLTKWDSTSGSNCTITDSVLSEASGKIGLGNSNPAVELDVSGTIRAVLGPAAPFGTYLMPTGGSGNGFRFGFGNNLYFDGTNWRTRGDGANNAGSALLTDIGLGHMQVFTLPPTGGTDQVVSNANFAGYEKMRISANGNVGIGTSTPGEKLDVIGNIKSDGLNKIVYLRPNGSTDGTQINNAINALPSSGGVIYLLPGVYSIDTTVSVSKNGVKLRGYGALRDSPTHSPLTTLKWTSSSHDTMIKMIPNGTTDWLEDLEIIDITFDGNGVAQKGWVLDRVQNSHFRRFHILNMYATGGAGIGIEMTTTSSINDLGCSWNLLEAFSVLDCNKCLHLTRNTSAVSNICHNSFINCALFSRGASSSDAGLYLEECDNNTFVDLYILAGTSGYAVIVADPIHAQSNYFYHLQPDRGVRVNNSNQSLGTNDGKNLIFGYDRANPGNVAPTTDSSNPPANFLAWIDSKGAMYGFQVN